MKTSTLKGMYDYVPKEAKIRDYLQGKIMDVYTSQGFNRIYTPIVEDIENLEKSDGGENLNLIFKILKRGEKFEKAVENRDFGNLCDMGLRYDLTLPLSRFFAEHRNDLSLPFKCIQCDRVYRAERPQKGRNREFVQCDIDIIGSKSSDCEIELIDTTSRALLSLGLNDFTIKINHRGLLKKLLIEMGFCEQNVDSVCITFDKLDKIGCDGVRNELLEKGFNEIATQKFINLLNDLPLGFEKIENVVGSCEEIDNLKEIIAGVTALSGGKYKIEFDLSLVRGQSYYTGAVFEIKSNEFSSSVGGGGRYDNLIGKFIGESVPAVGFSIGFERIYSILSQKQIKTGKNKLAIVYDEGKFVECQKFALTLQKDFDTALFVRPKKLGKMLDKLEWEGYYGFVVFGENDIKPFKVAE